jgi:GT2 family glycosyltransferase
MNITAVVVTYNRKALLQECIGALLQQQFPPTHIIVVDNSSTDGTGQWLQSQQGLQVITQPNNGGSWGFYSGVAAAYRQGADWVWIMDDDTIPYPGALAALVRALQATESAGDHFGYFVSKAVWKDGTPHLMNQPVLYQQFKGKQTQQWYAEQGIIPVKHCSFVSLMIRRKAITAAGLPVKEMFIWNDDYEYTTRLRKQGFTGALVEQSVVLHKTPINYMSDLYADTPANLWKYRYGVRNELYVLRCHKSYFSFVRNVAKRFVVEPFRIAAKRKSDRSAFIKVVWQGAWEALWFNPPVESVVGSR